MLQNITTNSNHTQLSEFERTIYNVVQIAVRDTLSGKTQSTTQAEFIEVPEAMQILGIRRTKLQEFLKEGVLKSYRLGRNHRFKRSDVYELLNELAAV